MPSAERAWTSELDRLDADLDLVEQLLADGAEPDPVPAWSEPDLGPLPRSLVARAQALLERQTALRSAVTAALASNAAQQQFASRVNRATAAPAAASYLDLRA
ncbi:hypothetical protein [Nocardioides houyundeii]|uniref:hypothetical protein n=1 Tax=Nocardioides houyundeii TaxID=2045452 RepID=UPI000DF1B8E7|nr:hypothetical protein [Nocardioides houyundeii]